VDYDNVLLSQRRNGLEYVVDRAIRALGLPLLSSVKRVHVRLYGGWYLGSALTRAAQTIVADALAKFPQIIRLVGASGVHSVLVSVDLAYSLAIDPGVHLWHTFRERGAPQGLRSKTPRAIGCAEANCPLTVVHDFVMNDRCPLSACGVTPEDLLYRSEQKLVDTMLSVDLIHYSAQRSDMIGVVSSDDDIWPAINTALLQGKELIHLHTRPGRSVPYYRGAGAKYLQRHM
jgi:uncharacterized LabA/DUF88 family protein